MKPIRCLLRRLCGVGLASLPTRPGFLSWSFHITFHVGLGVEQQRYGVGLIAIRRTVTLSLYSPDHGFFGGVASTGYELLDRSNWDTVMVKACGDTEGCQAVLKTIIHSRIASTVFCL